VQNSSNKKSHSRGFENKSRGFNMTGQGPASKHSNFLAQFEDGDISKEMNTDLANIKVAVRMRPMLAWENEDSTLHHIGDRMVVDKQSI
jgi:hypothetical protein